MAWGGQAQPPAPDLPDVVRIARLSAPEMSDPPPRITSMEVEARVDRTSPEPLMDALDLNERRRRALDSEMFQRLAALEELWPDDPSIPDLPSELAARQGISAHTAVERLRIARALRELPNLARAHAQGRLSWDQLRWVSRFATPETDREWAQRAPMMRPDALRLESLRQRAMSRRDDAAIHSARSAWTEWEEGGEKFGIHARLGAEQGAAVEAALNDAAQKISVEDDVEDRRGARLADALVALVTSAGGRRQLPSLVVHADAEVLMARTHGKRRLAESSAGAQLHADAVRRLACDAKVLWALERDGQPVGLVPKGRTVTDHLMEMLLFRDRGCTFPGCGSRWFLHAHHIRHWADGGKTTLENLTLLCGSHHRRLHEGGWVIRGSPPDGLEFVSRTGQVMTRAGPVELRAS